MKLRKKRSEEHKKNISKALILKHKEKQWGFEKGHIPWHQGKKGLKIENNMREVEVLCS